MKNKIITGIDIGTSKIRVVLGKTDSASDIINVIGYSEKNAEGMVKGEISDMIKVSNILNEAVKEAEEVSNSVISPETLYVGVTGDHIISKDGAGTIFIDSKDHTITSHHIKEVLKSAKSFLTPAECVTLDSIDGHFIVDDTFHVSDPLGQTAKKLEAHTHIIYANHNRLENFQNVIKDLGFESCVPVFSGMASALAVLTSDDFEHGTLVINMGAGTTESMLFKDYIAQESSVLAVGCNHIINDLYIGLEVGLSTAKDILMNNILPAKKKDGNSTLEIKGTLRTRNLPLTSIEKIVDLRLTETFEIIKDKLKTRNLISNLNNGIVLCGGAILLPQLKDTIKKVFDVPVRIGKPIDISGPEKVLNSPGFITALGLLRYGAHEFRYGTNIHGSLIKKIDQKLWTIWKKTWRNIVNDTDQ